MSLAESKATLFAQILSHFLRPGDFDFEGVSPETRREGKIEDRRTMAKRCDEECCFTFGWVNKETSIFWRWPRLAPLAVLLFMTLIFWFDRDKMGMRRSENVETFGIEDIGFDSLDDDGISDIDDLIALGN